MQELDEEIPFDDPPQHPPHTQVGKFCVELSLHCTLL